MKKTKALAVMSAFLMSAAIPVFAQTDQEEGICRIAANNFPYDEKTQDEAMRVENTTPETMETVEQRQEDFRHRLQGGAAIKAETKRVVSTSPETTATLEKRQEDLKQRLQGVAVSRAETKRGGCASPETMETVEQKQEDFKARLQGMN